MDAEQREAAIGVAGRALDQYRHGRDERRETCSICRDEAVLIVDAFAADLSRAVLALHFEVNGRCWECGVSYPCPTACLAQGEPLDTIREQIARGRWPLA